MFTLGGVKRISEDTKQQILPSFKSRSKVYKEEIGDTAVLLCKVNNLGELFFFWIKSIIKLILDIK